MQVHALAFSSTPCCRRFFCPAIWLSPAFSLEDKSSFYPFYFFGYYCCLGFGLATTFVIVVLDFGFFWVSVVMRKVEGPWE
ncbi:hypothetical protein ES288_D01G133300v1 [Gossypium darwinii]|uniref:Uncharacterized protein n=2 Tax=Gossypium TaxID=3633 RepID=A0A5D2DPI2_GOSDA|nr:hypothetical protein ES288_D01G133300v1 [Gossypium darwinii]TYG82994.1 hypothetical protein ES288_D01G133300v1 [Gossypium darwinii]TYH87662.1 hypothetical protein ES332_D01G133800v1 [Gossypium tomentosum]